MMKPSGFQAMLSDLVAVHGLHHQRLEQDHGPEDGQQDAQQQGKVPRAHAGALTDLVVGGAPRQRRPPRHMNMTPEKKSFWLLIFTCCLLEWNLTGNCAVSVEPAAMWISPTHGPVTDATPARQSPRLSPAAGVAMSTSSMWSALRPRAARRPGAAVACRRPRPGGAGVDMGFPATLSLKASLTRSAAHTGPCAPESRSCGSPHSPPACRAGSRR
jgi:hypothetical protein